MGVVPGCDERYVCPSNEGLPKGCEPEGGAVGIIERIISFTIEPFENDFPSFDHYY